MAMWLFVSVLLFRQLSNAAAAADTDPEDRDPGRKYISPSQREAFMQSRTQVKSASAIDCYGGEGGFTQEIWPHCHRIKDALLMYYGMTPDARYLKLGLHAAGHTGWSALALAGNSGMKGATHVVVRKVSGTFEVEDRYSLEFNTPQKDTETNVRLMFAAEENGGTSWGVLMPVDTCDDDDYPIEDVSRWMLWAKGQSHDFYYHASSRGQFHANLVSGPSTLPDLGGLLEVDLTMSNVEVVAAPDKDQSNSYICQMFDLEQLMGARDVNSKHHVVKLAPKVGPVSAEYNHHLLMFQCFEEDMQPEYRQHGYINGDCESMPPGCGLLKYAWAVGGEDIILPSNVGMPFGEGQRWLVLQMHYYNPAGDLNVRDSSGVSLTFASALRAEDAGVMQLNGGLAPWGRDPMPPGHAELRLPSFIPAPECDNHWTNDLNIVALMHHAHLLGVRLNIDVSRDGVSLGPLRRERKFDFNHQSMEPPSVSKIKRGDQLNMTYWYDTSSRSGPTPFGELSDYEMCWTAILYYPLQSGHDMHRWRPSVDDENVYSSRCGPSGWELHEFTATAPSIPECVASGRIDSAEAVAHIKAAGYATTTTAEEWALPMTIIIVCIAVGLLSIGILSGMYLKYRHRAAAVSEGGSQAEPRAEAVGAENAEEGSVAGPEGGSQAAPTAEIVGVESVEEGAAAGPEDGSEAAPTAEIVGVENMEEGAAAAAPAVASGDGRQAAPTADSAETGNSEEQQTIVCCQLV